MSNAIPPAAFTSDGGIIVNHAEQDGVQKVTVNVADVLGFAIAPDMARAVAIALLKHATLCDGGTAFNVGTDGKGVVLGIVVDGKPKPLIGMDAEVAQAVGARLVAKGKAIVKARAEADPSADGN